LKEGDEIRLIELYNVKVEKIDRKDGKVHSVRASLGGEEIRQSMPKIQWIAKNDIVDFKVMIPKELYVGDEYNTNSLEIALGGAESFVSTLKPSSRVQFVRFGFCRIDGSGTAILTHR
jgi:glutamyl-tRNA synthetase